MAVDSWLILGPTPWALPEIAGYELADALAEETIDLEGLWPAEGDGQTLRPGAEPSRWAVGAPWPAADDGVAHKAWAATYVSVDFYTETTLRVWSEQPVRILLDGVEVATRATAVEATSADDESEAEPVTAELKLTQGKHLLLVTSVREGTAEGDWSIAAELTGVEPWSGIAVSTNRRRHVGLRELLDQETVRGLDLSPDGRYLRVRWSSAGVPADHAKSWHQIVDVESGDVIRELHTSPSGFAWSPDGSHYAWATSSREPGATGHDLWISPIDGGTSRRVLADVQDWSGHRWLLNGSGLIVETVESAEADERGFKRFRGPTDRWAGQRDESRLWWVPVDGGGLRQLSFDQRKDDLTDVGIDRLLLNRLEYGGTERPFSATSLFELDLETLKLREIASKEQMKGWVGPVQYLNPGSEDDRRLVVLGSPQLFGGAGRDPDLPADQVVNDYETEAYLFDPATGEVAALTKDWDPTVNQVFVTEGALWIVGQDQSYQRLYRYDLITKELEEVPSGSDVVGRVDVSRDGATIAYLGEGPSQPETVFVLSGGDRQPRELVRGGDEAWRRVDLGRVETFSFVMDEGTEDATEILGRVNYPPDFDPSKKYPLIVSYYGGTLPSDRAFGGRYPRSYWAAHGFMVYTVQPSGATGFGQEFSARHVNAWGRRTADEILEGTKRFLDAHPFVDPDKVGCIGASYGGFMTMYLVSHSDLFAAGVSHAGIANLASYWGQGWWGYLYSAAASADSYPWNARDLYIDQSPLYAADEIETPLLLLHGDQDTNVPPVESHQMYTALKVLGRDVELIEVGGEDHQIFYYPKRKLWMETIVAYFTKYLHDRPEWWTELWGTSEDPKG
ncbi:MAG: prolyl oligopeptidase family serine peptidase [Thermoanaerobaculia bacterium]|nr:prolyl oligopeptidase family serine peptidase [Thermoanaerobaculia bacterium]